MPGLTGPPPKKDAERRRRNKTPDGLEAQVINVDELLAGEVEIPMPPTRWVKDDDYTPEGDEEESEDPDFGAGEPGYVEICDWHPVAEQAYWSLAKSGQVIFMEPSDWMTAYALCEMLSRELKPKPIVITDADGGTHIQMVRQPVNGSVMNAFLKGWASLMATEGDRRKLRLELERRKRIDAAAAGDGVVVDIVAHRQDVFKREARG